MKHRLDQEPDAGGHSWKKGKGRWRLYVLYIDLCLCIVDVYVTEPWYLDILLYPVTLISYCLLLQHVRANKASLQTLSVSSLVLPLHQLLRVDQQHRYRPWRRGSRTLPRHHQCKSNFVRRAEIPNWAWSTSRRIELKLLDRVIPRGSAGRHHHQNHQNHQNHQIRQSNQVKRQF